MNQKNDLIPCDVAQQIDQKLSSIEKDENVKIIFAIESGSRAWGFPSPDSDFDVRFVYVRNITDYLVIQEKRDVIELPIEGDLDINGWDIKKALQLLIKPNPVLMEWMRSPILYRFDPAVLDKLEDFACFVEQMRPSNYHYYHLAESQYRRNISSSQDVKLKKYFYVLRPILALRWMQNNKGGSLPMTFQQLMDGVELPVALVNLLNELITKKAATRELGTAPRISEIDNFIEQELDKSEKQPDLKLADTDHQLINRANTILHEIITQT